MRIEIKRLVSLSQGIHVDGISMVLGRGTNNHEKNENSCF